MRALSDRVRQHAVNADSRQQQSQPGEKSCELRGEARLRHRRRDDFVHARNVGKRQIWIDLRGFLADGCDQGLRIRGRADDERHGGGGILRLRHIHFGNIGSVQPGEFHVAHDADDFHLDFIARIGEMPADGILRGKIFLRDGLVDDYDRFYSCDVLLVEHTAAQQRDAHRLQVVRRDLADGDHRVFADSLADHSLEAKINVTQSARERQETRNAGGLHAGQNLRAFNQTAVELGLLRRLRVAGFGERHQERGHVGGTEAGVYVHQVAKTFHQQSCPGD